MRFFKLVCSIFLAIFFITSCNQNTTADYNKVYKDGFQDGIVKNTKSEKSDDVIKSDVAKKNNANIPQKVYETLDYIKKNNRAPEDYVGGRHFGDFENNLPKKDNKGNNIDYKEYDVNPKVKGKNRGAERLVIGDDGRAWYTNNHYKSFIEVEVE